MEEQAIADYTGIIANAGLPLYHDLLRQIAQSIVHERDILQGGQGGCKVDAAGRPTQRPHRQGAIRSLASPTLASFPAGSDPAANPHIHIISANWADQVLTRNLGFKNVHIHYQESVRTAATTETKLQIDFLRKLANLL